MVNKNLSISIVLLLFNITAYSTENNQKPIERASVVGATAGMGRAGAKLLSKDGYIMGLASRRIHLLESLQEEIGTESYIKQIDISDHEKAAENLQELIAQMGGLDMMFISISAYSDLGSEGLTFSGEKKTIDVDLVGFWVIAKTALDFFEKQNYGHLVGISSISGIRGSAYCPAYSGAKAFVSTYLEGVRNKMLQNNIPIYVTDIVPGWVDVEHTTFSQLPGTYWVTPLDKAAKQIFDAIKAKKKVAYVSKRQVLIAALLKIVPDFIFNWMGEF